MTRARVVRALLGIAGAFAVIEVLARSGLVDETALPPASVILGRAVEQLGDEGFRNGVGSTLQAWAGGILIAIAVAVPLGLALGSIRWLGTAARVVVEFMRPIPSVALIPLAIVVFASTTNVKMSLIVYAATWPILINTLYALRDVDPLAKDTLRSFGFGRLSVLWRVTVPSAAPFVTTGVRISASIGLVVVISAELFAGGGGLGTYLSETQSGGGRTDLLLAGALWAGVLGLIINGALVWVERKAFAWHAARTEASV
jgi:NitT/TauT family transport system permease protein